MPAKGRSTPCPTSASTAIPRAPSRWRWPAARRSTCFAALHEPFDKQPSLVMRRVDERPAAIGVCVAGAGFADYACVSFSAGQTVTLSDAADAYQSFSCGDYGYLRVTQGKVIARGAWRSFRVAAPEAAPAGALVLNGREAPYRKQGGYVLFNDAAEPPRGPAPAGSGSRPRRAARGNPRSAPRGRDDRAGRAPPAVPDVGRPPPGYEMHIHRKFGVSRTLIDGQGQLLFGSEWWGGSGVFEVRLPGGAEETAPFAWNHAAKEIRWRGPTMEVVAPSGESFTATFGPHAIRYGFHGKPNVEYRAGDPVFLLARQRAIANGTGPAARRPAAHAGQLPLDLDSEPGPFAGLRAAVDPQAAGRLEPSPRQHRRVLAAPRRRAVHPRFRAGGEAPRAGGGRDSRAFTSPAANHNRHSTSCISPHSVEQPEELGPDVIGRGRAAIEDMAAVTYRPDGRWNASRFCPLVIMTLTAVNRPC